MPLLVWVFVLSLTSNGGGFFVILNRVKLLLLLALPLLLAGCFHTRGPIRQPEAVATDAVSPGIKYEVPEARTGTTLEVESGSVDDFFLQIENELNAEIDALDAPEEDF